MRLTPGQSAAQVAIVPKSAPKLSQVAAREEWLHDIRIRLQDEVIRASDSLFDADTTEELHKEVEAIVDRLLGANDFAVTRDERLRLVEEVIAEVGGLGPLEPLLRDESITEVMVNGPDHVYIERAGKIQRVDVAFLNDEHVLRIIDRIITPLGRRIDKSSPRVDARLPDGSRVNAVIEPLSLVGPVITIRKFAARPFTVDDLIRFGTATAEMFEFLRACVEVRLNIFVSGGTGLGQDDDAQRHLRRSSPRTSGSSRSRTPPSCSSARSTSSRWRRGRRTSRARARSRPATCCATPCTCAPTGSSSASAAGARPWT